MGRAYIAIALLVALVALAEAQKDSTRVARSKVDCGPVNRSRRGHVVQCTISVVASSGANKATPEDFDIQTRLGAITWVSPAGVASDVLTFAYLSPQSTVVLKERLQVSYFTKKLELRNIQGSPYAMNLYGIPSELSQLSCSKSIVKAGDTIDCSVALYDADGVPTSGFGADFTTSSLQNDNWVMSPRDKLERTFYTFTYTAPALRRDYINAILETNGLQIQGAPWAVTIITPPASPSSLSCDKSELLAGESASCVLTVLDKDALPTFSDLAETSVAADSGTPLALPDDLPQRSEWRFVYVAPSDRRSDTITARISGAGLAMSFRVSISTRPSMLSLLSCDPVTPRAGDAVHCQLAVRDLAGNPTLARASDFAIESSAGGDAPALQPVDSVGGGRATLFTFSFECPEVAFVAIKATLKARGPDPAFEVQGSPFNVVPKRDRISNRPGNNRLLEGQQLESKNGLYKVRLQMDGNLVFLGPAAGPGGLQVPLAMTNTYVTNFWSGKYDFSLELTPADELVMSDGSRDLLRLHLDGLGSGSVKFELVVTDEGELVAEAGGHEEVLVGPSGPNLQASPSLRSVFAGRHSVQSS